MDEIKTALTNILEISKNLETIKGKLQNRKIQNREETFLH